MVKTAYIFDNIVPATKELGVRLNEGYEIVDTNLFSLGPEDDYEQMLTVILVNKG